MQINPEKASNIGLPPHGKNNSGLLPWQVTTVMNLKSSCFIYLDSTEVTHTQIKKERKKKKNLEGFEDLIEEGGLD